MAENLEATESGPFSEGQLQSSLYPLRVVRRHKWLVLLGSLAGLAVGTLYYARATPIYESSAQVLVVKKTPDALPLPGHDVRAGFAEDYLPTHQTLIRSPAIVSNAVHKAKLGGLPSLAGCADPIARIIAALKVTRETNGGNPTNILNISFLSSVAEDCAAVIKAVIDGYQQFLGAKYKNVADETAELIAQASDILEKKLSQKQQEYERFSLEHPTSLKTKDGLSTLQHRLLSLEAKRSALLLKQTEIQGRLDAFEKLVKTGRHSQAELLAMIAQTAARSGGEGVSAVAATEERLAALEFEEKTLLEEYGPDHPKVRSVRKRVELLRAQMGRLGQASANEASGRPDPVQSHIQSLKLELENTCMAAEALGKLLQEEQRKAQHLRGFENQEEAYRMTIARSQQLLDAISKRLDEVSLLKNFAGGYEAEVIAPPSVGARVYPKPLQVFAVAALTGLLAGFGLAYLAELSDQSFRAPDEIRRHLGLPLVGHIPLFEPKEGELPPSAADKPRPAAILCTLHHPLSPQAEAYRSVRTALYSHSLWHRLSAGATVGHKVIQVTSADARDGKTALAANLAVSIAQSKKKVILVDADFRRPCIHKLFNLSAKQGLASALSGEAQLGDAIQPTVIPGLALLPCGPIPANPAELLVGTRFQELLAGIREQYDYVLIDTPPLLAVTDPCIVASQVDGVLLTLRITKRVRPHALRAKEILTNLGAKVFGVVVNGLDSENNDYGYAAYEYSMGQTS